MKFTIYRVTKNTSLRPRSTQPKDVLEYVYYCLGKDTIPFQDLVFYMAFDLKLFPPSECENMLKGAKNEGLIDIDAGKIVKINKQLIEQKSLPPGKEATGQDIVNTLALDEGEITKAVNIKQDSMKACDLDAKTGMLVITFMGDVQGKTFSVSIDPAKRILHQEYDEDVSGLKGKQVLLKYALRAVMLRKDDKQILDFFRLVLASKTGWKFTYARVSKPEKKEIGR